MLQRIVASLEAGKTGVKLFGQRLELAPQVTVNEGGHFECIVIVFQMAVLVTARVGVVHAVRML